MRYRIVPTNAGQRGYPMSSNAQAPSNLRVGGGVAGMAEASVTMGGATGGSTTKMLDPSSSSFWVAVVYTGSILWLLWIRFIFRGAAL